MLIATQVLNFAHKQEKFLLMKILLKVFIPFLFLSLLLSCLDDKGGNSQSFVNEPLVVVSVEGIPVLKSRLGDLELQSPDLKDKVSIGDCLLADFMIKFEDQTDPYTISELYDYRKLEEGLIAQISTDTIIDEPAFPDSIIKVNIFSNESNKPALINNKMFFTFQQSLKQGTAFAYKMVYYIQSGTNTTEVPRIYILAKSDGKENPSEGSGFVHYAFDMTDFINAAKKPKSETISFLLRFQANSPDGGVTYQNYSSGNLQITMNDSIKTN